MILWKFLTAISIKHRILATFNIKKINSDILYAFKQNGNFINRNIHTVQSNMPRRSPLSCSVIENFIWIDPLLRSHLMSYKAIKGHFFFMSQRWPLNTVLTLQFILHVYYVIAVERLNSDMIVHVYMLMISSTFCTTTHTVLTRCFCWKSLTCDFSVFFHWECSGIPANYFLYIIPPLIERGLYCNHFVRLSVRSHFRNRYLSFYWKKWFYIWYMALAWWLVLCLPFPGLPHIYSLFTVWLRIFHVCRNENFRNSYLSFYWKKWFYIWYMALAW